MSIRTTKLGNKYTFSGKITVLCELTLMTLGSDHIEKGGTHGLD